MKYFLTFIIGVLIGVGGHWYVTQPKPRLDGTDTRPAYSDTTSDTGQRIRDSFDADKIKDELARTGRVIREKAKQAGNSIADATSNARITTVVKAKLVEDSGLSAFKIDVDTTDGVVTLSGTVEAHDQIARAMDLAWETDGVHKVISTLQVQPK